jgi:hypothetical protein
MQALIAAQLEVERGGNGGRPSQPEREYVLINIALVCPPSGPTGRIELIA